jgi:hypothetical protein
MVKLAAYKQNFQPHDVPPSLAKLVAFDANQDGFYSSGFELAVDDKSGIESWSDDEAFLGALFPSRTMKRSTSSSRPRRRSTASRSRSG